ncbi:hypothetical protein [Paenibacillus pini]|nr:hypothetical protein [Paenibacillus pini]
MENHPTLEELLFTLDICIKELPSHAHPAHYMRIEYIKNLLKRQMK